MEVTTKPTDEWGDMFNETPQDQFQEFRQETEVTLNDKLEDTEKEDVINDMISDENSSEVSTQTPENPKNDTLNLLDSNTTGYLNKLFEEGIISPFEGEEVKTYEDFKDLLQVNIKSQIDSVQGSILESELNQLPPQFQSVMKYGMNGGTDVKSLLESWQEAERIISLDTSTDEGKKQVVAEYLSTVGYGTPEMIANDIKAMEDLGTLDSKVALYKPKLEEMQMQRILVQEQQAVQQKQQEEQFFNYFISSVESVLTQDKEYIGLEIPREMKQALYEQSQPQYVSQLTGNRLDALEAIVEEAKYGQNANPAFYTELMLHATYPEEYKAMLLSQIKAEIAQTHERKLRSQVQSDMGNNNHVSTNTNNIKINPIKF